MSSLHFWTVVFFLSMLGVVILTFNPSTLMRAMGRFEIMYFVLLLFFAVVCIIAFVMISLQPR